MMKLPKELTTVTPLSKFIAVILFIALPLAGFLIGMSYQEMMNLAKRQEMETNVAIPRAPTPTSSYQNYTYRSLSEALKEPDKVHYLDLSKSNLTQVPPDVLRLQNLNSLYLNYNKLTDLPENLVKLEKLKLIDLTGNPILINTSEGVRKIRQLRPDISILHIMPMNLPQ